MDVSIIIVNWNTKELLRDCLTSSYEQVDDVCCEVIVVDNASVDGSTEMVKKYFSRVSLIENSENLGYAAACNQGIRIANGRYLLVLNSDTVICDSAIAKTVRYADKHPEAAVVGCQVWENQHIVQMTCFRFPSVANLFLSTFGLAKVFKHNRIFGREWMLWWKRDSEKEVDVVSGMFMLVRREAIDEIGLMDETFFMFYEETDWCYRFCRAGWKVLFWPGARIIHIGGGSHSSNQAVVKMFVQKQKSMLIFFRKHYGRLRFSVACLLLTLSFVLCFGFWVFSALVMLTLAKDISYQKEKISEHWSALKFCVFGCEPKKA